MYGDYLGYGYGSSSSGLSNFADIGIWAIIAGIIALAGGICLYFTVFSEKNADKYTGFMAKLFEFVKFKKLYITSFLKITFLINTIYITLVSFGFIGMSFLTFILILVGGNIINRLIYELSLVLLGIYENVSEINKKTKK